MTDLHRRSFLKMAGALPLMMMAPQTGLAASKGQRVLVLIELKGGNDGLNTVIPFADERYYSLRPALSIARDQVLKLDEQVGLHPAMEPLMAGFKAKDCAIIQGVGYEQPNRSHFRSIDIWETASDSKETLERGWLTRQLSGHIPKEIIADAIAVGPQEIGPLRGELRTLVLRNPAQMLNVTKRLMRPTEAKTKNKALAHLLATQDNLIQVTRGVEQAMQKAPELKHAFPKGPLGQQAELATKILASKLPVMVLKLSLGSFDTHANQLGRHKGLLEQLSGTLSALRLNLMELGLWEQTLIMTYSEFGRRAAQNASKGTDHGTSAPHFVMGGKVKGGLYGQQPSLSDLANQDLKHHVDFRQLYATVASRWWSMELEGKLKGHKPLELIKP